jgi:hypothetical protein
MDKKSKPSFIEAICGILFSILLSFIIVFVLLMGIVIIDLLINDARQVIETTSGLVEPLPNAYHL